MVCYCVGNIFFLEQNSCLVDNELMAYDPDNQYRCSIIRTKAMSADDLLPSYAKIIDSICPIEAEKFPECFNRELEKILPGLEEHTYNNHRTETVGKLFGMYYEKEQWVHCSQHTEKLLKDGDQPAFFKDICFKLQFPNGMDSSQNIEKKVRDGLRLRPCIYLIKFLQICTPI